MFDANWQVYGVRKVWLELRREGFDVARCTVARLMKRMGIQGIIRGKPQRTTIPDKKLLCPLDRVNRQFRVPAPNMLWVSGFTDVQPGKGSSMSLSSLMPMESSSKHLIQPRTIQQTALLKGGELHRISPTGIEIIKGDRGTAFTDKKLADMRANIACPTGHQPCFHVAHHIQNSKVSTLVFARGI